MKRKNHTVISIDADKAFEKIYHPLMMTVIKELSIEGTYLNITKATRQIHDHRHTPVKG